MNKYNTYNKKFVKASGWAGSLGCAIFIAITYFLLLGPDKTVFSFDTWCQRSTSMCALEALCTFCILPIYFSLMIFGGGAVGWLIGKKTYKIFNSKKLL